MRPNQIKGAWNILNGFIFVLAMILGFGLGLTMGILTVCWWSGVPFDWNTRPPNNWFVYVSMLLSIAAGFLCVTLPLYLLGLKAFFTDKAVRELWASDPSPEQLKAISPIVHVILVKVVMPVFTVWFEIFFPPRNNQSERKEIV